MAGVLLIEIGASFSLPVGVANQLNATHSLLSLLTALAMAVLSIKFSMESLLYAGIGISMVSAVGCLLAPSFQALFLLYSLNGIVCSLIYPMSVALVGELIPKERQADAMSKMFAVPPIITVFVSPFVGYIGARALARSRTYFAALENGVAPWMYAQYLHKVFPPECVTVIENSINEHLPVQGKIFEVEIFENPAGERMVDVKPIHFSY